MDKIEIESFEEDIREYAFYYRLSEFGQTLLDSYAESSGDEEFYRYSFDYFGLAKAGSGTDRGYDGFGRAQSSYSSGIWKYGLSGNDSFNFGFSGNIGGYVGVPEMINLGLSGTFGGSIGFSRVLTSVMDVDGDGIPELVWKDREDSSNLSGYNPISGSTVSLDNYGKHISKDQSLSMNLGGRISLSTHRGKRKRLMR